MRLLDKLMTFESGAEVPRHFLLPRLEKLCRMRKRDRICGIGAHVSSEKLVYKLVEDISHSPGNFSYWF